MSGGLGNVRVGNVGLDHVGLNVADLPAMRDWYAAALGLEVELEFQVPPSGASVLRGATLRSPAGFRVELLHRPQARPGIRADGPLDAALTLGFGHVALAVPSVDAAHAALLALGATDRMSPRPSPEPGVRMAFVADPEGNLVELVERPDRGTAGPTGS